MPNSDKGVYMFNDFFEYFDNIHKEHNKQEEEYDRLRSDPPKALYIGDKVLVALGLLGYGFRWIREKGEIIAIADSSVFIKFERTHIITREPLELWIEKTLITDIIERTNINVTSE